MTAIIHEIEQGTEEWFEIRKGKMTSSKASCIAKRGKGLETYCKQIVAEIYGEQRQNFSNKHTQRGHDLEPFARQAYEIETGIKVKKIGFVTNPDISILVGSSPDGHSKHENGGQEIKCLIEDKHNKFVNTGKIITEHMWQMQMQMLVEEQNYKDYILYNPLCEQSLAIKRVYPNGAMRESLILGIQKGEQLIIKYLQNYGI